MYEVFDSKRVARMGEELGYMGTFKTMDEAASYIEEYKHLFEGDAVIKEYVECRQ